MHAEQVFQTQIAVVDISLGGEFLRLQIGQLDGTAADVEVFGETIGEKSPGVIEQLVCACDISVYLLHLCLADDQLIIHLIYIGLYRFFGDLCRTAGIVERGFSCLKTDEYLAVE